MGCAASVSAKVVDFDPVAVDLAGDEVAKQSTLRSWTATPIPGVPCPPNRTMHELHLMKMEKYAGKIEKAPHELHIKVACKRLDAEILSEQILSEQMTESERIRP
ncbi:unnamed protein product [Cladocopium goreaui]|uniref:Uncharacterized protein n=1 Tax=Cladocopium goreaui TaxID=2562237 RepID=A0A9P1GRK2_9DINO|nr:unnamed protein product [Cladocopium goreaui]